MAFFGYKDLSSLSEVDLTIYRYVAANSDKVVYMRVRDIAKNAHVSNSSVMRFVHKLGFNSFPEFKSYLKNNKNGTSANKKIHFFNASNFPKDISNQISIVADAIYQSDNVITVGMGDSAYLAEFAARRMASLGLNTTAIPDPFYPLRSKLENTSNTIIICFSVSGETTEMIELMNIFVNNPDVTTVAITSDETSTLAKMSRYVLNYYEKQYRLRNFYDMSSQVPVMYIIDELDQMLASKTQ